MTFNVREWTRDRDKTSPYYWRTRLTSICRCVLDTDPDIICVQECWPRMLRPLKRLGYKTSGLSFHHTILTRKTMRGSGHRWRIFYDWLDVDGLRVINVHSRWERKVAEYVIKKVGKLAKGRKAVACGDFNVPLSTIKDIGLDMSHARSTLGLPQKDTFQNFTKVNSYGEIDHFFLSKVGFDNYKIITASYGCERMSDHYPVILEVKQ